MGLKNQVAIITGATPAAWALRQLALWMRRAYNWPSPRVGPTGTYDSSTSRIQGRVVFSDGVTPAQGHNVIARKVGDPRRIAVSSVSGYLFTPCGENTLAPTGLRNCGYGIDPFPYGSDDNTLIGYYNIPRLPPADYTIEVEAINNSGDHPFVEGSGVGPIGQWLEFQFAMPGARALLTATVTANNTEEGKDLVFNGPLTRYDAWEDGP